MKITSEIIQRAALGIINARRSQWGVEAVQWDDRALSDTDKQLAIEQAKAALEAALQ